MRKCYELTYKSCRNSHRKDRLKGLVEEKIPVVNTEMMTRIYDLELERRIAVEKTEGIKYKALFMLAAFVGSWQGELLGLKWSDVDWKNSQVHVQRTFTKGRFFTTKTDSSNRKALTVNRFKV